MAFIVALFPSPKGGGPIEAVQSLRLYALDDRVSIAERRWPH